MANKLSESFELLTSISPKGIPLGEDFFIVLQSSLLIEGFDLPALFGLSRF
jgi:hypothetical protein